VYRDNPRLQFDDPQLRDCYDRRPFIIQHFLASEPLLTFDRLAELALRLPPQDVLHRVGKVPVDSPFDDAHVKYAIGETLRETLKHFDALEAVVTINTPEKDPEYRPLAEAIIEELRQALRPLGEVITWYATYFFVSARGSITPYHMDRELNFLLQIQGIKRVRLWDPWDQRVMTTEEVEKLFALWGKVPRPQWLPRLDPLASETRIEPGLGIHHPFIAPHVVETLEEKSVSWAITFRTRASDRTTELAKINYFLRRLGMRPGRPGSAAIGDSVKLAASAVGKPLVSTARMLLHRANGSWVG
jgi:hypothetical protein